MGLFFLQLLVVFSSNVVDFIEHIYFFTQHK